MKTNVKSYTDEQLLKRVSELDTFDGFPNDYWQIWVRSNEDEFNKFDDKVYLFRGKKFISVHKCTTNAGKTGLLNFEKYNKLGVAVLKSDIIIYDSHVRGLHRGKVMSYRQNKPWPYYRDNNKDKKSDENGVEYNNIIWANIHPATYEKGSDLEKEYINGWSLACLVRAKGTDHEDFMRLTEHQKYMTNCIIKEF